MELNYHVYDKQYKGPLDSLLKAARKQDVQISQVNISRLLDEFIEHINLRENWLLTPLSAYLLVFSELVRLKTRSTFPRPEKEEHQKKNRELDREQKFFVQLGGRLRDKARRRSRLFDTRPEIPETIEKGETEYEEVSLFELIKAFRQVMITRQDDKKLPEFNLTDEFEVAERKNHILELAGTSKKVAFYNLLSSQPGREEVIVTFLALLQLVKNEKLSIIRSRDSEEIFIIRNGKNNGN